MIEQLFGSKTRVKLLRLFFSNPNRSFYVREITRTVEEQINSVRRELANLLSLGLITSDSTNNKLYYEVNQDYEHYDALQAMFAEKPKKSSTKKTESPKSAAKKAESKDTTAKNTDPKPETTEKSVELPEARKWNGAGNISGIAYSGAYTRDESAGVDILIIGDVVLSKVESIITELEKDKNIELRYAVIDAEEWKYRGQVRDKFWLQIMGSKIQVVLDKDSLFEK